jgi:uncharacterized membrane protein YeiB
MTCPKLLACAVAGCVLTLSVSAQQATVIPVNDSLAAVSTATPVVQPVLPESPPQQHKFFDREQLLALSAHSGMRLLDTVKTCRELSHGGTEVWIPTQSCGGIAVWQVGSLGLALGVGWMFHRHGHHRLERITPWVATGASAAGWTKSVFNIH